MGLGCSEASSGHVTFKDNFIDPSSSSCSDHDQTSPQNQGEPHIVCVDLDAICADFKDASEWRQAMPIYEGLDANDELNACS